MFGAFVCWTALREAAGYGDALTDEHLIQWMLKSGYHAAFARVHQNWEMDWLCIIHRDLKYKCALRSDPKVCQWYRSN